MYVGEGVTWRVSEVSLIALLQENCRDPSYIIEQIICVLDMSSTVHLAPGYGSDYPFLYYRLMQNCSTPSSAHREHCFLSSHVVYPSFCVCILPP